MQKLEQMNHKDIGILFTKRSSLLFTSIASQTLANLTHCVSQATDLTIK